MTPPTPDLPAKLPCVLFHCAAHLFKTDYLSLASVAQWIERWTVNQSVACSIPNQVTCLSCRPGPQHGACKRQPHINVSLPLSPSLPLSVKIDK